MRGKILQKKIISKLFSSYAESEPIIGVKRKADDEVKFDENGNWTLETAKNRLSKLYQAKGLDFNAPLQCSEVGFPPNKQYQCQFSLEHENQTFSTCVLAENKKTAQRRACLDVVIQLYQAGLIPGNKGDRYGIPNQPGGFGNKVLFLLKKLNLTSIKRGRGTYRGVGVRPLAEHHGEKPNAPAPTAAPWEGGKFYSFLFFCNFEFLGFKTFASM